MKSRKGPYLYSLAIHIVLALILYFIKIGLEPVHDEYVTIGFGAIGKASSSGVLDENPVEEKSNKKPEIQKEEIKKEIKKVDLPKVINEDKKNNVVVSSDKKESIEETKPEQVKPITTSDVEAGKGKDESGDGEGNYGFEIDFGGKGMRKIYSYTLPTYPEGVSKEIDVKLKFSILPDGTVGKIYPLIKADTRLEQAAINSLRQWRFEPITDYQTKGEQFAVIIFPFRLQ